MNSDYKKAQIAARTKVRAAIEAGRLTRPDGCSRCDADGDVHAHHDDYSKPLDVVWLCRQCHAKEHVSNPEWVVVARSLRTQGATYEAIGEAVEKSFSAVYKRIHPDAASQYNERSNKGRRPSKRESEARRKRRADARGECKACGGPMGIGQGFDGTCATCRSAAFARVASAVEDRWHEGESIREIAAWLGRSVDGMGSFINRLRGLGYDLPYRSKTGAKHVSCTFGVRRVVHPVDSSAGGTPCADVGSRPRLRSFRGLAGLDEIGPDETWWDVVSDVFCDGGCRA